MGVKGVRHETRGRKIGDCNGFVGFQPPLPPPSWSTIEKEKELYEDKLVYSSETLTV